MKLPPNDSNIITSPTSSVDVGAPEGVTHKHGVSDQQRSVPTMIRQDDQMAEIVLQVPVLSKPSEPIIDRAPIGASANEVGLIANVKDLQDAKSNTRYNNQLDHVSSARSFSYTSPTVIGQISINSNINSVASATAASSVSIISIFRMNTLFNGYMLLFCTDAIFNYFFGRGGGVTKTVRNGVRLLK